MKCFIYILFAVFALAQAKRSRSNIVPLNVDVMKSEYDNKTISRIVGSMAADPHSLPYQAALFIPRRAYNIHYEFCGGSIISKDFILTAARCLDKARTVEVILGAHKVLQDEKSQESHMSREFIVHPEWNPKNRKSPDIALIKLPTSITFRDEIQPISLPKYDHGWIMGIKEISGWGKDSDQSEGISLVLRFTWVVEIPLLQCKLFFLGRIGPNHVCTSGEYGRGACTGDYGGPVVDRYDNRLRGIISFGLSFGCELGWPTVSTRVGAFLDWIHEHTGIEIDNH